MSNWWADFSKCISTGSDEDVTRELQKVSASDTHDREGNNLLHYVAHTNRTNIAECLISLGCNVNHKNNAGRPPIINAVTNNQTNMVKILMSKGAVISNDYYQNEKGPIHFAAECGLFDLYKMFLQAGCDTKPDANGTSILHYASLSNSDFHRLEFVKTLIDDGFDVNAKCNDGETPLHYVCAYGNSNCGSSDVIDLLLKKGADLDAKVTSGTTPLFWAVIHGKSETVLQLLRAGSKVDEIDPNGKTCLHYAIQNLHPDTVKVLLDHNASLDDLDSENVSPLWQCLRSCCVTSRISREQYDECDVYIESKYSREQVDKQVKCLSYLIEYGADINLNGNINNLLTPIAPINAALLFNHYKIVRLLLNSGAVFDYGHKYSSMALKRVGSQDSKSIHELMKYTAKFEVKHQRQMPLNYRHEFLRKRHHLYLFRCRGELDRMKTTLIYRKLTFLHVLLNSNFECYVNNEQVINTLVSNETEKLFPIYYELLLDRLHDERERLKLVEESICNIIQSSNWAENYVRVIFGNVCRYLGKIELRKLARL